LLAPNLGALAVCPWISGLWGPLVLSARSCSSYSSRRPRRGCSERLLGGLPGWKPQRSATLIVDTGYFGHGDSWPTLVRLKKVGAVQPKPAPDQI